MEIVKKTNNKQELMSQLIKVDNQIAKRLSKKRDNEELIRECNRQIKEAMNKQFKLIKEAKIENKDIDFEIAQLIGAHKVIIEMLKKLGDAPKDTKLDKLMDKEENVKLLEPILS